MTDPDLSPAADAGPRVAADPGAAAVVATRLQAAAAELTAIQTELAALLIDVDMAVGTGNSAGAFRTGFSPAAAASTDRLHDVENRLGQRRRALVAGIDDLLDRDAEASARIGRADA